MRLWIALHLPQLPLEVFSPNWSSDKGSVVLEQERVLALSPLARQAGVLPGMRRGGVLMLMPEARLHERTAEREAQALHDVAMALLQYTPLVTQAEESTLLMDIGASLSGCRRPQLAHDLVTSHPRLPLLVGARRRRTRVQPEIGRAHV